MSRAARIGIIIAVVVAAFLIATLIIAPRLFEIDTYRPEVISLLEEKTGREVEIGHLSLVLFPTATIRADNVAIANPAGFPSGNMLTVKRISARLDLGALLHRQIVIRTLKLDQLALNLTSNGKGNWNSQMSDPPAPHVARASGPPTFALGEISKIELSDGTLSVKSLAAGRSATPTICKGVSGELDNVSLAMLGRAGSSSSLPSRDLTRGVPKIPNATGSLSVVKLNVGALQATRITSKIKTSSAEIQLNDLRFDFYQGKGTGNVRLEVAGADPQFQAEAHLSGVSVQKLLEAFPASHGGITGQLEATLNLSGDAKPASKIWGGKQGEGTVTIRKGRLPKLQLNKSLLDFVRLAQLGPAKGDLAAFSSITADWHLEHGVISSRSVRIIGTGITVNGSGSSDLAGPGHLHYQGIAAVEARKNILTNVLAGMAGSELKDGKITLPFVLEGTFSNPIFRLNPNAQAGLPAVVSRPEKREQILKGVFKFFQNRKSQSRQ